MMRGLLRFSLAVALSVGAMFQPSWMNAPAHSMDENLVQGLPIDQNEQRTMPIRVTDDEGKPLENARLTMTAWPPERFPTWPVERGQGSKIVREYLTNSQG